MYYKGYSYTCSMYCGYIVIHVVCIVGDTVIHVVCIIGDTVMHVVCIVGIQLYM